VPTTTTLLNTGPSVWLLLAILLALAATVSRLVLGIGIRQILLAGLRALIQLGAVAVIIAQLGNSAPLAVAFVLLMLAVASWTVSRRLDRALNPVQAAVPILAGVVPVTALMLALGVLPLNALALAAVLGQLIGGSMTATNLAGRRLRSELRQRHGEFEAGLALGFSSRQARALITRPVAGEALLPALDQTRTVGTVTLPGAFVGLILGGASPLDAGMVQLLVLVSLLAAEATAIAAMSYLAEYGLTQPRKAPK
jgi:putative ABC transport system permease protein